MLKAVPKTTLEKIRFVVKADILSLILLYTTLLRVLRVGRLGDYSLEPTGNCSATGTDLYTNLQIKTEDYDSCIIIISAKPTL
ncbi:hypothetical protein VB620_06160 [Nodularia harveyana UHCC-0300]|uniref:Uncharacterized protein n=1 Tax=Nodularia harveyana UHCC-0300 TaxID=2974287 RepID=A0ABU5UBL0_9CYAN|nr:hypothetical protein [Nodularia harveyana]MEA5580922.1 hypothetical protein [Nodularia harveyana UHCC-0300]